MTVDPHRWSFVLDEQVRLLVADDDPILREFAKVHLATPTAEVEIAADGLEALRALQASPFDLALIDLDMPGLDGYALTERIRAEPALRHLPVVVVTGFEDIRSIDRAYAAGATSFIVKPVNWRQLSHQIRYILRTSRLEREARFARDRAERASALKSAMFALMRHEFRTPLNAVIGFSEVLGRELHGPLPNAYREPVAMIGAAGRELLDTLSDVLHCAQLLSGEHALSEDEYGLADLMEAAARAAAPGLEEAGLRLTLRTERPERVFCDRDLVLRLLGHLIRNAALHGGPGEATLSSRRLRTGELAIELGDRGRGMSPDQLALCREPFSQGDALLTRRHGGLGLGLATATRTAELHGGKLEVESQEGAGTTVRLVLPAARLADGRTGEAATEAA